MTKRRAKRNGSENGRKKLKPVKRIIRADGSCICKACGHRGHKSHTHCKKCDRKFKN